jgi:hypothetical protein
MLGNARRQRAMRSRIDGIDAGAEYRDGGGTAVQCALMAGRIDAERQPAGDGQPSPAQV